MSHLGNAAPSTGPSNDRATQGAWSRTDGVSRFARVVAVALAAATTSACTHVAPYDRGRLAHPMMTSDIQTAAAAHVTAVQEGAIGGGSVAESGCGCN